MNNKKAINPVVSIALLLTISVISVVGFQNWFQNFENSIFLNIKTQTNTNNNNLFLNGIINNIMYIQSNNDDEITTLKIINNKQNTTCEYNSGFNNSNLIGNWDFENKNSTHILDLSNSKNHGAINGNYKNGNNCIFNSCMNFDGTSHISFDPTKYNFELNNFSISVWIKFPVNGTHHKTNSGWEGIITKGFTTSGIPNTWGLTIAGTSNNIISFQNTYTASSFNVNYRYNTPQYEWEHFFLTRNNSKYSFYQNGKFIYNYNPPEKLNLSNLVPLKFGLDNSGRYLKGTLDEIKIYNDTLTKKEISNLYYFNNKKIKIKPGQNKISTFGCRLNKNEKYEIFGFTKSGIKIEKTIIVK